MGCGRGWCAVCMGDGGREGVPSRVSSSLLTKMRMGSRMNLEVTSSTSKGMVAEKMVHWTDSGMYLVTNRKGKG